MLVIPEPVVDHGAVEGGIGTLMRIVLNPLEPPVADPQGILELSRGTEDIHLEVEIVIAGLVYCHQHGVAIQILQVVIMLANVFALSIES